MQTYNSRCKYEVGGHSIDKTALPDLLCLSHLRWSCISQRPVQLARWSRERRVFFIEEPLFQLPCASRTPKEQGSHFLLRPQKDLLLVVTPYLPPGISEEEFVVTQRRLLDKLMASYHIDDYLIWYHTKVVPAFTRHLLPRGVIYDCVDDLSPFDIAPREPDYTSGETRGDEGEQRLCLDA
jgi:hypothetical protein